jgi:hypothetical protein
VLSGEIFTRTGGSGPNGGASVVFSADGWATVRTTQAVVIDANGDGSRKWSFEEGDVPFVPGRRIELAASLTSGGDVAWDNNFGRNYSFDADHPVEPDCSDP